MIININTTKKYNIEIDKNLLDDIGSRLQNLRPFSSKVCILTDDNVHKLYMHRLESSLLEASFQVHKIVFTEGESMKTFPCLEKTLNYLAEEKFTKSDTIIALGGGVVGDLAGFAASIYHRGIPYIQVPTTLLAAVDSSLGGKTAINLAAGKNLVGSFWQPEAVYFDITTLETLEKSQLQNGMSEIIKAAVIGDKALFQLLEDNGPENLGTFISEALIRAINVKKKLLEIDEHDYGVRKLLNLGHTIGHAVEKISDYSILHGRAVAIGLLTMATIAEKRGWARESLSLRISNLLDRYKIDCSFELDSKKISQLAASDKKRHGELISLVIPQSIGQCKIIDTSVDEIENLFALGMDN